jgi:NitT/TauT family transport system permease protein
MLPTPFSARPDAGPTGPGPTGPGPTPRGPLARSALGLGLGFALLLVGWALAAQAIGRPYLLPTPQSVLASLAQHHQRIGWHASATLGEILVGFALGFVAGTLAGYAIARSAWLEPLVSPLLVTSQAVPVVAVAPLLVYWFGTAGLGVKAGTAAVIVFFPVVVNTVVGLRSIDRGYRDLLHVLDASRWQTLRWLELPAALPMLLGGLRVGVTLAVVGAVVGEFLGGDRGLGALIQIARAQFNDALLFAALVTLVALALALYGLASALERLLLRHHDRPAWDRA